MVDNPDILKVVPVVLSGGTGTRLWPASRETRPKPFMMLADGETLISKAYSRAKALGSEVLTVTNRDYYLMSRAELEEVGIGGGFILEPFCRSTAPAIALAAKYIEITYGSEAIMLLMAADHLIDENCDFTSTVQNAARLAANGYLVTFGIIPTGPETGFGYIEQGELLNDVLSAGYRVARFVEKPDLENAKVFFASGNYFWNSGMFCFKAGILLEELDKTAPEVAKAVEACWLAMLPLKDPQVAEIPAELFKDVPEISIDYAVMERSDKVVVMPARFGWNDIGSWSAFSNLVEPDAAKNRALGDVVFVESENIFVQSEERLVATVGVKDLIIIDTSDALLVVHPNRVQDVKKVVAQLKKNGHDAFKLHRKVFRPWGTYTVLEEAPGFKIKRIEVKPGASLSLQIHHHRSEHWVVVSGSAKVTNGDSEIVIEANESTYIPSGQKHRLENPGQIPCVLIEVQCGSHLDEEDIVRLDDKYGR